MASNAWFAPQVAWAEEKGYVNGKSADTFDPNGAVTRQEAMTILFRTSGGQSGGELMFTSIYDSQFTDSPQIASWAKPGAVLGGLQKPRHRHHPHHPVPHRQRHPRPDRRDPGALRGRLDQ